MARTVDQLSRAIRASVLGPVASTNCPRRLGPGSEGLRGRPTLLRISHACPKSTASTSCPGKLGPVPEVARAGAAVLGDLGSGPRDRGVDQLFQVTRARVRVPSGSTSSPGRLGPVSKSPWGRSGLVGDSCSGLSARLVDRLSRATRALVLVPVGSTSSPGQLVLGSEGPWGRQVPRVSRARVRRPVV